jgi:RNA polymerase subunit RPABC4/transcription elongation factor Spt4
MIACSKCGSLNDEATRICRYCGSGLDQRRPATQQREYVPPSPLWADEAPPPQSTVQPYGINAHAPDAAAGYRCPFCGTTQLPLIEKKISTDGWLVFAALLLFCFPFFWVGLLMKKEHHVCPVCRVDLG